MTIEIRELVIQARVNAPEELTLVTGEKPNAMQEELLIQKITLRVLEQLRDADWGYQ